MSSFYDQEFIGILEAAVGSTTWELVVEPDGIQRPCVLNREVFTDAADNLSEQQVFVTSATYKDLLEPGTAINIKGRCENMLVSADISDADFEFKCLLEPGEPL